MVTSASEIQQYLYCRRKHYLMKKALPSIHPELLVFEGRKSKILKWMSSKRHSIFEMVESGNDIGQVMEYLSSIYPGTILEASCLYDEDFRNALKSEVEWFGHMKEDMGYDDAISYVTPVESNHYQIDLELGLCARIDKIYMRDGQTPALVKASEQDGGDWQTDIIRLCAFAVLLERSSGGCIDRGYIEYVGGGESQIAITDELRSELDSKLAEAKRNLEHGIPEVCCHGNPRKCKSCELEDICYRI